MTFDDCDSKYLVLGRNGRAEDGNTTAIGRLRLAHKGIGKLAGFGIANDVTVRTVKNGKVTAFKMSFNDIQEKQFGGEYYPEILEDEKTSEKNNTSIILEDIKLSRTVNEEQFMKSMQRRFSLMSDSFKVMINDKELRKMDMPLQVLFPDEQDEKERIKIQDGWGIERIGGKEVRWWIGFTEKPIPDEDAIGISVLVRGKIAQTPWFFDLVGGATGQLGMRYMIGEIMADFLDDEHDLIVTDRASVTWSHELGEPLKE